MSHHFVEATQERSSPQQALRMLVGRIGAYKTENASWYSFRGAQDRILLCDFFQGVEEKLGRVLWNAEKCTLKETRGMSKDLRMSLKKVFQPYIDASWERWR